MRRGVVVRVEWGEMKEIAVPSEDGSVIVKNSVLCRTLYLRASGDWSPVRAEAVALPWNEAISAAFKHHACGAHAVSLPEARPELSPSEVFADLEKRGLA